MKWERGKKGEMDRLSKKHEKHNAHILKSKWIVNHLVSKSIKHLLKSEIIRWKGSEIIRWKGVKDRDNGKQTNEKEQKRKKWRTVLTTQQQFNKCSLCFQGFLPDDGCFHIKMIRFFILSRNLLKQRHNEEKCLRTTMFFSVQGQHLESWGQRRPITSAHLHWTSSSTPAESLV